MDQIYKNLLADVIMNGKVKENRTGIKTHSVFGRQVRFDMEDGFPIQTTKKIHWKSVVHELLWFISGDTNIEYLQRNGVRIWDEWADDKGDLGPVYGKQWRRWESSTLVKKYNGTGGGLNAMGFEEIDQLGNAIEQIKNNPDSRRIIVSAWNPSDVPKMALPPCHTMFQFYVDKGELSCQLYQRSADLFLGVPFNIASYALLLHMIAVVTDTTPKELIITFGDLHIYENHLDQCQTVLDRVPQGNPEIGFSERSYNADFKIEDFKFEDITLTDYTPHPAIKAEVAI